MAEVHVIGQVTGASDFSNPCLSCRWKLVFGANWRPIEGSIEGLTQLDCPQTGNTAHFSHPIDVHFLTSGLQGWPKFEFEVWQQDSYRRTFPVAYGFLQLPSTPGRHQLTCLTWRPIASGLEEIVSVFSGGGLRLETTQIVSDSLERFRLQTESSGKINIDIYVITRHFDRFGIES